MIEGSGGPEHVGRSERRGRVGTGVIRVAERDRASKVVILSVLGRPAVSRGLVTQRTRRRAASIKIAAAKNIVGAIQLRRTLNIKVTLAVTISA